MNLFRLSRGHVVAAAAALVLLLVMAMDWYTTAQAEDLRRDESLLEPDAAAGPESAQIQRDLQGDARIGAEQQEQIAWQPDGALDWLVLLALVATVIAALAAAALRASNRRYGPPMTPAVVATSLAMVAAVLVVLGMIDRSTGEAGAEIAAGVPLGLLCLGAIALGSARAARSEQEPAGAEPAAAAS